MLLLVLLAWCDGIGGGSGVVRFEGCGSSSGGVDVDNGVAGGVFGGDRMVSFGTVSGGVSGGNLVIFIAGISGGRDGIVGGG